MNGIPHDALLAGALVFCRIGACLMLMPGFASSRIPVRIRLAVAVAATAAIAPVVSSSLPVEAQSVPQLARAMLSEMLVGLLIGLIGRLFLLALETLATAASMSIGLSGIFASPIDDGEQAAPGVTLMSLSATLLFVIADLHLESLKGLIDSYAIIQAPAAFDPRTGLVSVADALARSFLLTLQICSPLIAYGLIVNLAFGVLNKLIPQMAAYFVAIPFTIVGGLALFYVLIKAQLGLFSATFLSWLVHG